jgi:hypothetical protein
MASDNANSARPAPQDSQHNSLRDFPKSATTGVNAGTLEQLVAKLRCAKQELLNAVRLAYPIGTVVTIRLDEHATLIGVVHTYISDCPTRIVCMRKSGNAWDYPLEDVSIFNGTPPDWIRELKGGAA